MKSDQDGEVFESLDARDSARHLVGGPLMCSLGKVIDLSQTGALVVTRREPPKGVIAFHVGDAHGSVSCAAEIVWTRRCGLFRHESGLRFPQLASEQVETLRRLIATHATGSGHGDRRDAA
ncbi:MAG: PilZ domain-containing protein [Phycisphaerales bacterium]